MRHADRLAPLFDQGRVVDRQNGVDTADQILGLADQFKLQGLRPPSRGRDEVMELLEGARCHPIRHRLDALALSRPQQPPEIDRRPMLLRRMPEMVKEGIQPVRQPPLPADFGKFCQNVTDDALWFRVKPKCCPAFVCAIPQ
jgi:hypothetical protein